jgi:hypothetical protein
MAFWSVIFFSLSSFGEDKNPLGGLENVRFASSIKLMGDSNPRKEFEKELQDRAEKTLKENGIITESKDSSSLPLLFLLVQGNSTKGVVVLHWELQLQELVDIPANDTYRKKAFHGKATIWRAEGIATAFPNSTEKEANKCIDNVINTFVKHWKLGNEENNLPDLKPTVDKEKK